MIQTGTVAALSIPFSKLATGYGKNVILFFATLAYTIIAFSFIFYSDAELGNWSFLPLLAFMYGIARTSWENTTKAIFADLFPGKERAAAFSSLNFCIAIASTVFAFSMDGYSKKSLAVMVLVPALAIIPGYYLSVLTPRGFSLYDKYLQQKSDVLLPTQ